jgi:hypothetical protein
VKLNSFQQLMWRWSSLCPYNVGHVVKIEGVADLARWRSAITETIRETGLGIPKVRGDTAEFAPVDEVAVAVCSGSLDEKIEAEMNRSFAPDELPVRFFILENPDNTHWLGAFFDHWIADSKSFRGIMHLILRRYQSPAASPLPALKLDETTLRGHFGFWPSYNFRAVMECVRDMRYLRSAYRLPLGDPMDFHYGFHRATVRDGLIDAIRANTKKAGCTVNDIFIAAAAQALGAQTATARDSIRTARDRVSIGTAVDIRPLAQTPADGTLGLLVSYFTVAIRQPEKTALRDLCAQVASETRRAKSGNRLLHALLNFQFARFFWDISGRRSTRAQMCHRGLPVALAVSNENFTGSWIDVHLDAPGEVPRILDYFRVPPVGPLSPVVVMPTTTGDRLSITFGWRKTAFSREQMESIAADFLRLLETAACMTF